MFSDKAEVLFHLNSGLDRAGVIQRLNHATHMNSYTNMASGLEALLAEFSGSMGDRLGNYGISLGYPHVRNSLSIRRLSTRYASLGIPYSTTASAIRTSANQITVNGHRARSTTRV